jgi:hypothetical protein
MRNIIFLLVLSGCMTGSSPDVSSTEEDLSGCPFTRWNTLEFGSQLRGWPDNAHGSDCTLVANATELGKGSSYICLKDFGPYTRIFIPVQRSSCTLDSYVQNCGNGITGCTGEWTHAQCDGYERGDCWTL